MNDSAVHQQGAALFDGQSTAIWPAGARGERRRKHPTASGLRFASTTNPPGAGKSLPRALRSGSNAEPTSGLSWARTCRYVGSGATTQSPVACIDRRGAQRPGSSRVWFPPACHGDHRLSGRVLDCKRFSPLRLRDSSTRGMRAGEREVSDDAISRAAATAGRHAPVACVDDPELAVSAYAALIGEQRLPPRSGHRKPLLPSVLTVALPSTVWPPGLAWRRSTWAPVADRSSRLLPRRSLTSSWTRYALHDGVPKCSERGCLLPGLSPRVRRFGWCSVGGGRGVDRGHEDATFPAHGRRQAGHEPLTLRLRGKSTTSSGRCEGVPSPPNCVPTGPSAPAHSGVGLAGCTGPWIQTCAG